MWVGDEEELVMCHEPQLTILREVEHFKGCPNCKDDAYLMDLDNSK